MDDSQANQSGELSRIIASIQNVDTEKIVHDDIGKTELLKLARKLTAVLEGPVNKATDLVFKVNHEGQYTGNRS